MRVLLVQGVEITSPTGGARGSRAKAHSWSLPCFLPLVAKGRVERRTEKRLMSVERRHPPQDSVRASCFSFSFFFLSNVGFSSTPRSRHRSRVSASRRPAVGRSLARPGRRRGCPGRRRDTHRSLGVGWVPCSYRSVWRRGGRRRSRRLPICHHMSGRRHASHTHREIPRSLAGRCGRRRSLAR